MTGEDFSIPLYLQGLDLPAPIVHSCDEADDCPEAARGQCLPSSGCAAQDMGLDTYMNAAMALENAVSFTSASAKTTDIHTVAPPMSASTPKGSTFALSGLSIIDLDPGMPVETRAMRAAGSRAPAAPVTSSAAHDTRAGRASGSHLPPDGETSPVSGPPQYQQGGDEEYDDEEGSDWGGDDGGGDDGDGDARAGHDDPVADFDARFQAIRLRLDDNVADPTTGTGILETVDALRALSGQIVTNLGRNPDEMTGLLLDILAYMANDEDVYARSPVRRNFVGEERRLARAFMTSNGRPTGFIHNFDLARSSYPDAFGAMLGRLTTVTGRLEMIVRAIEQAQTLPVVEIAQYRSVVRDFQTLLR